MSDHNIEQIDQILLSFVRLDEIKIQELLSYDPSRELLTQLIQIFDNGTKEILQQVKSEFEINNLADVSKLTHRLRSTSLNLGATRLSEILKRIEYMALEADVRKSEIDFLIKEAEKESQLASKDLHAQLEKSKSL